MNTDPKHCDNCRFYSLNMVRLRSAFYILSSDPARNVQWSCSFCPVILSILSSDPVHSVQWSCSFCVVILFVLSSDPVRPVRGICGWSHLPPLRVWQPGHQRNFRPGNCRKTLLIIKFFIQSFRITSVIVFATMCTVPLSITNQNTMYYNWLLHSKFLHDLKFYQSLEKKGIRFGVMCRTRYGSARMRIHNHSMRIFWVDWGPAFS